MGRIQASKAKETISIGLTVGAESGGLLSALSFKGFVFSLVRATVLCRVALLFPLLLPSLGLLRLLC